MAGSPSRVAEFRALDPIRIKRIVAAPLLGASPKGGWTVEIAPEDSVQTLIAVHTDAGITGFGSVFTDGRLVEAALGVLEPLYRNENALEPERVSEKLHQNTFWMGRGGTLTHAISGIDIALWDILGKATGLSVGRLMGGRYQDRVMPYCSLLMDEPQVLADEIVKFREQGFKAFKVGWGPFGRRDDPALDEAIVRAAVDVLPKKGKLMVDAGGSDAHWPNGLKWALRTADMLAEHDVAWFEEALRPDALEDFATLRRESRVLISGGEVLTRRQAFMPFLTAGAFDIIQPDVTKVGGLSEQRRIAWMAQDFGITYVGHGWNTALGIAADLQLATALPNVDLVEYIGGSAYVDDIMSVPFALDADGMLAIPDKPGLGVSLDREKVAHYSARAARLFEL
jgi:L-alanine-DL-glutamate epimerase-like enolase superfamily enzyme